MNLPLEIIEIILGFCDCKTLKTARNVHPIWKHIIDELIKKRCILNIGEDELYQYQQKWIKHKKGKIPLEDIYENWINWRNIEQNIEFNNEVFIFKIEYASCLTVSGQYLAIGLDTGCVHIYNNEATFIKSYDHLSDREPRSIQFTIDEDQDLPSELLIEYEWATFIHDFNDNLDHGVFHHQRIFTACNQLLCGIDNNGCLTIARIVNDEENRRKSFSVITKCQIDLPISNNTFASLTTTKCIVLIENTLININYLLHNEENQTSFKQSTTLKFSMENVPVLWRDAWIFHHNTIMTITQPRADMGQILEIFIVSWEKQTIECTKKFLLHDIFESVITGMFLYGNTLAVGFANGTVLLYEVTNWQLFDIAKYSQRITMHTKLARILSIDAIETYGQRIFYVASPTSVRKITGTIIL